LVPANQGGCHGSLRTRASRRLQGRHRLPRPRRRDPRALPKGRGRLADQLERAATSVSFNIAEGAGEFAANEKARIYRIARRSATECAAILDVCRARKLVADARIDVGRDLLVRIVAMLTKMILNATDKAST
jgi:four helix bundle protein